MLSFLREVYVQGYDERERTQTSKLGSKDWPRLNHDEFKDIILILSLFSFYAIIIQSYRIV